jgi:phosphatidate cytidylyltransferase
MLTRLITAAVLIPLVIVCLFKLPPASFAIISAGLLILASWEWSRLAGWESILTRCLYVLGFVLIESIALDPSLTAKLTPLLYSLSLLFWPIIFFLVLTYPKTEAYWGKSRALRSLMGYLALAPCFFILIKFATHEFSRDMLFICLLFIWGADSGAYFIGKRWGKSPLIPAVSPNKTIAGFVGALITGVVIAVMVFIVAESVLLCTHGVCKLSYLKFGGPLESLLQLMIIALWTVLAAVFGDLAISMLKRNVGVKDTGILIPGHGGVLDRIDSMLPALPFFVHFVVF